jgi:hypothetical protein
MVKNLEQMFLGFKYTMKQDSSTFEKNSHFKNLVLMVGVDN